MNVLFVCKGNTGRSQMAEAFFSQLNKHHYVKSAGTKVGTRRGTTLQDTPIMIECMKEVGLDFRTRTRTQLTPELVQWADKIIVMDELENWPEYLLKAIKKVNTWNVPDAARQSLEFHKQIRNQIRENVQQLIQEIE